MLKSVTSLGHFEVACERSVDVWTNQATAGAHGCKEMMLICPEEKSKGGKRAAQAPLTPEKAANPAKRRWSVGLSAVPVTPELVQQKREPLAMLALDDECSPCSPALLEPVGDGAGTRLSLGSFLASIGGEEGSGSGPTTPRERSAGDDAPRQPPSIKRKHRISKASGGSRVSLLAMARKGKGKRRSAGSKSPIDVATPAGEEAPPSRACRNLLLELNEAGQSHKEKVVLAFLSQIEANAVL
mmetsp:Transcript_27916/g.58934  ORF Transcript_27916/g.58934 Transcript_27916/m.58934 type:complete len:242 (+) Transcript_27916:280-1005(+)